MTDDVAGKTEDNMTIIQVAARVDTDFRDQLKLVAIKRKVTLNKLILEYLQDGLAKDKKSLE